MAKILTIADLLSVCEERGVCAWPEFQAVEAAAAALAQRLADELRIKHAGTSYEGEAFAGLASTFYAVSPKQRCPRAIHKRDAGGDWEVQGP